MKKFLSCLTAFMFLASVSFAGTATNIGGGIWVNGVNYNMDWAAGNVTYVPITGNIETYITAATAGDTLVLAAGTYTLTSALTITTASSSLTIRGMGKDATIITGAVASQLLLVQAGVITFEDLTIQNTRANGDSAIVFDRTAAGVATGIILRNVKINSGTSSSPSGNIEGLVKFLDCGGTIDNCEISAISTGAEARAVDITMASTAEAAATVNIYNSIIYASGVVSTGLKPFVNNAPAGGVLTVNAYNSTISGVGASGNRYAVYSARTTGTTVNTNVYGSTLNGSTYDAIADASAGLTLHAGTELVNGTTSGTITYDGTVVSEDGYFSDDVQVNGDVNGTLYSASKQHEEIGILLDLLTAPKAIVGFTGTGATTSTEAGYESGAGRTWTYSGGLTTDKIFQGQTYVYSFDGSSKLSTPDTDDMTFIDGAGANPVSMGGWIQITDQASPQCILTKWDETTASPQREWNLQIDATEKFVLSIYDEANDKLTYRTTDAALTVGEWYHVVVTYDATGGATALDGANCVMYVNGVAVASTAVNNGAYVAMANTTSLVQIGVQTNTAGADGYTFDGDMGRLFVTGEELTAATVWKMYESTRGEYNK